MDRGPVGQLALAKAGNGNSQMVNEFPKIVEQHLSVLEDDPKMVGTVPVYSKTMTTRAILWVV